MKITNKKQCKSRQLTDITDHNGCNLSVNEKLFSRSHDS